MRILVCALDLAPSNGHGLQHRELLRRLSPRHEVSALVLASGTQDGAVPEGVDVRPVDGPPGGVARRAVSFVRAGRRPLAVTRLLPAMASATARTLAAEAFDVVHVATGSLAGLARVLGDVPAVLAPLDAWHRNVAADGLVAPRALRPLYRLEEQRVRRYTAHAYRPYASVVMVTDQDAEACRAIDPTLRVHVVPNGVDSDVYAPDAAVEPEPGLVVFTGAMHWSPNVRAARLLALDVLPRVRAARADAHVALVGRGPAPEVLALGEADGVQVTGEVPDVRPWLHRAEVFACPMVSGTGIKNKLLEALACGRPCVATPLALQGTHLRDGRDLLVASTPQELADRILRLLGDPALRARLGAAGREHVVAHHSWASVARDYERIYGEAISGGR